MPCREVVYFYYLGHKGNIPKNILKRKKYKFFTNTWILICFLNMFSYMPHFFSSGNFKGFPFFTATIHCKSNISY